MLPHQAYADAPPILTEINAVLTLTHELHTLATPAQVREQQLRKAALLDRIALHEADTYAPAVAAQAIDTAEEAAIAFALSDSAEGCDDPTTGPDAPHWTATSYRGYVRQEYLSWLTGQ